MNEILSKVTPHTRGLIWIHPQKPDAGSDVYKAVDYLLNGLLTATLESAPEVSSHVMMTNNFHSPLHVFIVGKFVAKEYESYLTLLKKDLTSESTVLVIDEAEAFAALQSKTPKELRSHLHLYS
ncbi:MAG TPA: hypothetical protein VNJ08_15525 [Bacteriovoracaceae bacterium]|nr:hypothetical protein [Bacteriovoracaceae bacterium]